MWWKLALVLFLASAGSAGAVAGNPPPGGGPITISNPIGCPDVNCVWTRVYNAIFPLASLIATVMILVGAFQILFAAGNPEKLKTGRRTVMYALIGFAIAFVAAGLPALVQDILSP